MIGAIEALPNATIEDGAPATTGVDTAPEAHDVEQLLEAWFRERGRSTECSLLLGLVRRLLSRIVAAGRLTERSEREARRLLRAIEVVSREGPAPDA